MEIRPYALILHIIGFTTWIGSLFTIASALIARDAETDAAAKAVLAKHARAACKVADIGFTLALIGGLAMMFAAWEYYMKQPWLHMKLLGVMIIVGIHGFLRVKAKHAVQGDGTFPAPVQGALSVLSLIVVALVILKPLAR